MSRYGAMYGPDITFLGVDPCTVDDPNTYIDADVVIVGAPFDGREYGETAERINQQGKWAGFYRNATDHLGNKIGEHELKVIRLKTNG